jgi:hypothetical protein
MTDDATRPIETPITPEPAAGGPAPAEPMTTPVQGGANRARWAIGLGVAGLAIAAGIAAVVLFGAQASPEALRYIPGDAAAVAELRLDLPGDQMQHLGNLLAHFPGFADQSTLEAKLDEALAKLIESGPGSDVSYQADVKPWLSGPTFVGLLGITADAAAATHEDVVISATTNGAASCGTVFKNEAVTHETYKSLDLVISADGSMACVLDGRQALLGNTSTVRKALDAKAAGTGMNANTTYQAARSALGGDRIATLYVNGAALDQLMPKASDVPVPGLEALMGKLPAWLIAGVRAEDDALVLDYVAAPVPAAATGPSLLPVPAAHASVITGMVPSSTLLYVEAQGAGVGLQNLLTVIGGIPDLAEPLQMLEGVGGAGELVGWIDDVGIAVTSEAATTPEVAVLIVGTDDAAVSSRVAALRALLGTGGLGSGIQVTETTVNGTAVTNVTIADLGTVIPPGLVVGGTDVPTTTGPITFSMAARGRTLIVTLGEATMAAILNTAPGSSLADQAAFKQASAHGFANSRATVYIGVGATVDLVKGFVPAEELATYQAEIAPYVDPLEAVLISTTGDASGDRSRIVITVTKP